MSDSASANQLPSLTAKDCLFIGFGGAIGSLMRAGLAVDFETGFPWSTIAVNVLGALLLGYLYARNHHRNPDRYHFYMVGFCGSFTTVSLFSFETITFLQQGNWILAVLNALVPIAIALSITFVLIHLMEKTAEETS